ncbi:MAG TPA: UDP-N-acetylglucosamine 2-epimerase (non-hydrolyzing), partial [Bacillota bacterium]|nr:UDP-N-acetylglucosamine 2-epimerase (non-hydrolyzing) [Bacillota bacterium]
MKKVMAVFGTRPDTIKMMPVVEAVRSSSKLRLFALSTGQHRQMLDDVLRVFGVEPDMDLDIMRPDQSLADIVTRGLPAMMRALEEIGPDLVLVHGDTSTGFVASLASFYSGVKVGHVEAGLRTHDKLNPFPEEMNRKLIGSLADVHFAPLKTHKDNLVAEGVGPDSVFVTGNTAVDAVLNTAARVDKLEDSKLHDAVYGPGRLLLVTAHRRESIAR